MPAPPKPSIRADLVSAERFAARYPLVAGALGTDSREGSLERVREAIFYLGAVATEEIRALEGEGHRALAAALAPDVARPMPAATIVELSTEGAPRRVHAGAEIETRDKPACRFRLASDVDLGPWRVERARIERGEHRDDEALAFDLVATGATPLSEAVVPGVPLNLFVTGPHDSALSLVAHVLGHGSRVEVEIDGGRAVAGSVLGDAAFVAEPLAPEPDGPTTATGLLREYFVFPEKFAFVALGGVAEALAGSTANRATVRVRFDAPIPARIALSPDGLCAHCAPAVNLFPATSEPRTVGPSGFRFPIRVAGHARAHGGVYAVLGVSAARADGSGSVARIPPLRRFAAASLPGEFPYAFSTELAPVGPAEEEPPLFLSLTATEGPLEMTPPRVVSVDLLATNRTRASEVRPGDLSEPGAGFPRDVRVRNIVPTSAYVPAATGPGSALLVSVRAAVPRADPLFSLKALLFAILPRLGPRHGVDDADVRANLARIDAIERLDVKAETTASGHGYRASFAIDESRFRGTGDVELFLRLVHRALDAHVSINHSYRCEAILTKSQTRVVWPPEPSR